MEQLLPWQQMHTLDLPSITLFVIVTHLERKTCCHTLEEKCHAISDKEYITLFTNIKNSEQTFIEKGQ